MRFVDCHIEINTSPVRTIQGFTDTVMLKEWWGVEKTLIELKPGGIYTLGWGIGDDGIRYVSTGVVTEFIPAKKLHVGSYMYLSTEHPFLGPVNLIVEATPAVSSTLLHLQQGPYTEGER